jgi:hypothetical protein
VGYGPSPGDAFSAEPAAEWLYATALTGCSGVVRRIYSGSIAGESSEHGGAEMCEVLAAGVGGVEAAPGRPGRGLGDSRRSRLRPFVDCSLSPVEGSGTIWLQSGIPVMLTPCRKISMPRRMRQVVKRLCRLSPSG